MAVSPFQAHLNFETHLLVEVDRWLPLKGAPSASMLSSSP
ncbi:unnamed protein product [Ectocarpus sp. 6 AP-2014]